MEFYQFKKGITHCPQKQRTRLTALKGSFKFYSSSYLEVDPLFLNAGSVISYHFLIHHIKSKHVWVGKKKKKSNINIPVIWENVAQILRRQLYLSSEIVLYFCSFLYTKQIITNHWPGSRAWLTCQILSEKGKVFSPMVQFFPLFLFSCLQSNFGLLHHKWNSIKLSHFRKLFPANQARYTPVLRPIHYHKWEVLHQNNRFG